MSTKTSNGYRLAEGTDLWAFTKKLRETLDPLRDELDVAIVVDEAIGLVGEGPDIKNPLVAALKDFTTRDRKRRDDPFRDPHRFDVCIGQDPATGRIHALAYAGISWIGGGRTLTTAWERLPEVEEYAYWNNSDKLDYVSDQEWEERRKAWERVLPDMSIPAEAMLQFTLRSSATTGLQLLFFRDRRDELRRLVERAPAHLAGDRLDVGAFDEETRRKLLESLPKPAAEES